MQTSWKSESIIYAILFLDNKFSISGFDALDALQQAKKAIDHVRSGLNDQWNFHGLYSGTGYGLDGLPWCTSHYTFIWCYGTFLLPFRASTSRHQMPHFPLIPNFLVHTKCRFIHLSPQALYNVPFIADPTETQKQKRLKFCQPRVTYSYKYLRSAAFSIPAQSTSNKAKKSLGVRINS